MQTAKKQNKLFVSFLILSIFLFATSAYAINEYSYNSKNCNPSDMKCIFNAIKANPSLVEKADVQKDLEELVFIETSGNNFKLTENRKILAEYPEVLNAYLKEKYPASKIHFPTNKDGKAPIIKKYDADKKIIEVGYGEKGSIQIDLNNFKNAEIPFNKVMDYSELGFTMDSLSNEDQFTINTDGTLSFKGKMHVTDIDTFKKNKKITMTGPKSYIVIDGVKWDNAGWAANVNIEFFDDGYTVNVVGEIERAINDVKGSAVKLRNTGKEKAIIYQKYRVQSDKEMYHFTTKSLAAISLARSSIVVEDTDLYLFGDDLTLRGSVKLQDTIKAGAFIDPCYEQKNQHKCISINYNNKFVIVRNDTSISPSSGFEVGYNTFYNPSIDSTFEILLIKQKYMESLSKNTLDEHVIAQIENSFQKSASQSGIFDDSGTFILYSMALRKTLMEFDTGGAQGEALSNKLKLRLEQIFPNVIFDFKMSQTYDNGGFKLTNKYDPSKISLTDSSLIRPAVIAHYSDVFASIQNTAIDSKGQTVTGYIDNDGKVRLANDAIKNTANVNMYLQNISDIEMSYNGQIQSLSYIFSEKNPYISNPNEYMMNIVNRYIREYNRLEKTNHPEITINEAELLVDMINGRAGINEGTRTIQQMQIVLNKLPFFEKGLGAVGTDNRLGPLTSQTIIAFSNSLKQLIPNEVAFSEVNVYFNKHLFTNGLHFVVDVTESVSSKKAVLDGMFAPLVKIASSGSSTNLFSLTPYLNHHPDGMLNPISSNQELKQLYSSSNWVTITYASFPEIERARQLENPVLSTLSFFEKASQNQIALNSNAYIITTMHIDGSHVDNTADDMNNLIANITSSKVIVYFLITTDGTPKNTAYFFVSPENLAGVSNWSDIPKDLKIPYNDFMKIAYYGVEKEKWMEEQAKIKDQFISYLKSGNDDELYATK